MEVHLLRQEGTNSSWRFPLFYPISMSAQHTFRGVSLQLFLLILSPLSLSLFFLPKVGWMVWHVGGEDDELETSLPFIQLSENASEHARTAWTVNYKVRLC